MYADDLKNDYSHEQSNSEPIFSFKKEYKISIVHRKTGVISWTGTVMAFSKRGAQTQFRIDHADVRAQYTHEYGLYINEI